MKRPSGAQPNPNTDDVRMIQRGCGLRLLLKPTHPIRILLDLLRKDLQCDTSLEIEILSGIHLTHAARAERSDDLVVT
jgi:hypothetical protein